MCVGCSCGMLYVRWIQLWEAVCVSVTGITLLCVPWIVRGFKRQLTEVVHSAREPSLDVNQDATDLLGLAMFVLGLVDLCIDVGQTVSLAACGHWWLFVCSTATVVATTTVSTYLGAHMLKEVAQGGGREARSWLANHGKLAAFAVLASSSRLESLAILRLRLCGRDVIHFPIPPAYFHFIRHAGMFHLLLEDVPHALVGMAQLSKESTCDSEHSTFEMPGDARTIAILSVVFSLGSIVFGVAVRSIQMLVLRVASDDSRVSISESATPLLRRQDNQDEGGITHQAHVSW
jgi:hypothetical protein